jgi:hypothetical protein
MKPKTRTADSFARNQAGAKVVDAMKAAEAKGCAPTRRG